MLGVCFSCLDINSFVQKVELGWCYCLLWVICTHPVGPDPSVAPSAGHVSTTLLLLELEAKCPFL